MSVASSRTDAEFPHPQDNVFSEPKALIDSRASPKRHVGFAVKRAFDVVGATTILVLVLPLLPVLALAIRVDGGPALYRHIRIGHKGRAFSCLKYRTMRRDADQLLTYHFSVNPDAAREWAARRKLARDPRVTPLGAVLRATSLDEIPQLLNVLRGEMSLVGPRPVVQEELEQHYCPVGRAAYAATRPGITGLWQVSGRSGTSYQERVKLDIAYVSGWSLMLDIKIMLRTIPAVVARRGAV